MIVYAVVDDALSSDFPLGDALEVFIRREDAQRFIDEVRGDDPEFAGCSTLSRLRRLPEGGRLSGPLELLLDPSVGV